MPEIEGRITPITKGYRIDFIGLKSPAPLVGTLKALSKLEDGFHLEGIYPQYPIHLFPALREEGWLWEVIKTEGEITHLKIFKEGTNS
ncbi:hypothetical protein RYZ26_08160 [Terasakiella sp. A23]|uniref:hypothetical protein n=1 Tax=Terasakiella sp. FCG-A23 TaxID=3080561 RepID=UPI0029547153|nr:hypothetical protein [Terasakiella sp. A23]MDV7339562.1 hypothetical protein [Terasakiella sp. A23]